MARGTPIGAWMVPLAAVAVLLVPLAAWSQEAAPAAEVAAPAAAPAAAVPVVPPAAAPVPAPATATLGKAWGGGWTSGVEEGQAKDEVSGETMVVAAYGVLWLILILFVLRAQAQVAALRRESAELRALVESRLPPEGRGGANGPS